MNVTSPEGAVQTPPVRPPSEPGGYDWRNVPQSALERGAELAQSAKDSLKAPLLSPLKDIKRAEAVVRASEQVVAMAPDAYEKETQRARLENDQAKVKALKEKLGVTLNADPKAKQAYSELDAEFEGVVDALIAPKDNFLPENRPVINTQVIDLLEFYQRQGTS